eukprot:gb/GEZJ01000777.1/.p1 GENE.gb/GEZJ01000777.1/~~gb/GEZJ01000777.1/.p1  ORF type:complete len:106 (+),score=0.48 gb/GEZJ01000777.1/:324-641(+)
MCATVDEIPFWRSFCQGTYIFETYCVRKLPLSLEALFGFTGCAEVSAIKRVKCLGFWSARVVWYKRQETVCSRNKEHQMKCWHRSANDMRVIGVLEFWCLNHQTD